MRRPLDIAREFRDKQPGTYHTEDEHRVVRDKRMCTIMRGIYAPEVGLKEVTVFPLSEAHTDLFRKASRQLREGGPSERNPGAIGSLKMSREFRNAPHVIKEVQAQFKLAGRKRPSELGHVPQRVAAHYKDWRKNAFRSALSVVVEKNETVQIPAGIFLPGRRPNTKKKPEETAMFRDLQEVCDEEGLEIIANGESNYLHEFTIQRKK